MSSPRSIRTPSFTGLLTNLAFLAAIMLIPAGCGPQRRPPARESFFAMGTLASVSVPHNEAAELEKAVRSVSKTFAELEEKLSVYKPDSEISLINANAGRSPVSVSQTTINLLQLARHYGELSDGAFDVTIGRLMEAWGLRGQGPPPEHPPPEQELQALTQSVGWRHIVVSDSTAFLAKKNASLDLGGIAKGYAIDACYRRLSEIGIANAIIDLGGDIRCAGRAQNDEPWSIGIRNPFQPDELLGTISVSAGEAVATSGDYERFVTIEGRRHPHILDPRTGKPADGMAAVTVISRSAAEADALSTALFVQGIEEGVQTLKRTDSQKALFVPNARPVEIWVTPAFSARFRPARALTGRVFLINACTSEIMKQENESWQTLSKSLN